MHFYNDNDVKTAAWLGELVACGHLPPGDINTTSINDLATHDLTPYTQCHFFAGIGGWPLALRLAGWPDDQPVWTGSCPCQPFSVAGRGKGVNDERHLWPVFHRLIAKHRPPVIFGEQVAGKAGRLWLAGIRADLEALGYAVAATPLCAYAVGAPHERLRIYWVAHTSSNGRQGLQRCVAPQIPQNRPPQALGAWNSSSSPFSNWKKLLAESCVVRVDDGVSSTVDIRPRLRAYGNAIVPQLAAEFIIASVEAINSMHDPTPPLQSPQG